MSTAASWRFRAALWSAALALLTSWALAGAPARALPDGDPEATLAPGSRPAYRGLSLADALLELRADGLAVVFTSELVKPSMRVESEPTATAPRAVLDELLAPHGLEARSGPGRTLVVVRSPGLALTGKVLAAHTLEPLPGALIRLPGRGRETRSGPDGRFAVPDLEPGTYRLEASHRGYLGTALEAVVVSARPSDVRLLLQPAPFVHDAIVVRPSRLSLLREEPSLPLALSRGEIERLPHLGSDVSRALSLLPGVIANDLTARPSVRGGRRDEVQLLLDGQEIYDGYHLKEFDDAFGIVPSAIIQSLNLSTGAFPVQHGDRMGGVVEMRTAVPARPRHIRLGVSVLDAEAMGSGTFGGGRGGWLASARRGSAELTHRVLGPEDPTFWDAFGKLGVELGPRHSLRAHLLAAGDRLDLREVDGEEVKRFDTGYDSATLWLTHEAVLGRRLLVESALSRTRLERDRRGTETEEEGAFAVLDRRETEVTGLRQAWGLQTAGGQTVKWGLEVRRYDTDYDYTNQVEREIVVTTPETRSPGSLTRLVDSFDNEHLGLWATGRLNPLDPLTVELGLRHDDYSLVDEGVLSPRASLAWRLDAQSVLRASWGHFHQSQRTYELEVQDGESRFAPAERSVEWVLGYERLLGSSPGALRAEAYRREIDAPRRRHVNLLEPINAFPEIEPDRAELVPQASTSEGIELTLRGRARRTVDWWLIYAYARAEDRIAGREVRREIDQTHTVNLIASFPLGRHWSLDAAWRYHTGWPTTPVSLGEGEVSEEGAVRVMGRLHAARLPDYHRLDLRVSRPWRLGRGRLVLYADVQNLYDRANVGGFDLQIDEETGRLEREPESWPGFFASAGVSWEL